MQDHHGEWGSSESLKSARRIETRIGSRWAGPRRGSSESLKSARRIETEPLPAHSDALNCSESLKSARRIETPQESWRHLVEHGVPKASNPPGGLKLVFKSLDDNPAYVPKASNPPGGLKLGCSSTIHWPACVPKASNPPGGLKRDAVGDLAHAARGSESLKSARRIETSPCQPCAENANTPFRKPQIRPAD
ncbi:hypothetical protein OSCT_0294 [Oscillochloris trichoides DG-6]|uniref:Uncharacterized protein n=1 Tax=Oscillochloris trichoides DG-6 TaxID=765420 RepID=E1IAE3_9CHLR|nr:hypothetical protein OSCT_0294 [Oscillochloris trichoides DG-6]